MTERKPAQKKRERQSAKKVLLEKREGSSLSSFHTRQDTHNTALLTVALLRIFFALTACPNNKYLPSPTVSGHWLVSFGVIDVKVLLKLTLHTFRRGEQEIGLSEAERCIPIT